MPKTAKKPVSAAAAMRATLSQVHQALEKKRADEEEARKPENMALGCANFIRQGTKNLKDNAERIAVLVAADIERIMNPGEGADWHLKDEDYKRRALEYLKEHYHVCQSGELRGPRDTGSTVMSFVSFKDEQLMDVLSVKPDIETVFVRHPVILDAMRELAAECKRQKMRLAITSSPYHIAEGTNGSGDETSWTEYARIHVTVFPAQAFCAKELPKSLRLKNSAAKIAVETPLPAPKSE